MGKKITDKTAIYEKKVLPLIEKISNICEQEDIPALMAFQLNVDTSLGAKVGVHTFFTETTTQQLNVAAQVVRGEISIAEPDETAIIAAIEEHIQSCGKCAVKYNMLLANSPNAGPKEIIDALAKNHLEADVLWESQDFEDIPLLVNPKKSKTYH